MKQNPEQMQHASTEPASPSPGEFAVGEALVEKIKQRLRLIFDPEIPVNIFDLGLIYEIGVNDRQARIVMTLTSPHCPVAESLPQQVKAVIAALDELDEVEVKISWNPPWSPDRLTDEVKLDLGIL